MERDDQEQAGAELAELAAKFRAQLARHAAAGRWAAPAGASARTTTKIAEVARDAAVMSVVEPMSADVEAVAEIVDLVDLVDLVEAPPPRRSLSQIRAELGECTRCKLCSTRRSIVFGVGDPEASLMFVGEAPGEQEDRRGEPFVGPAGELLDKMIAAMGWTRAQVYIANTVKCRPPGNRNPEPDELAACAPFLNAQLASIAPRIIVALGRPAANQLLANNAPISALRGRFHDRRGTRVMPTFHPAYLLRSPERKRDAWSDLKLVMAELERIGVKPPAA